MYICLNIKTMGRKRKLTTNEIIESINNGILSNITGELLAIDIKEALQYLGEITGEITNKHLLDSIFKDFCIGK